MKPAEVRGLRPGQWITWTRSIWSTPIDGRILNLDPARPGKFLIEWDDGITTVESPEKLGRSSFQPRAEERPYGT